MLDLNLNKKHLNNTFALLLVKTTRTEQITNLQTHLIDTLVEVHHVIKIQIAMFHYKTDLVLQMNSLSIHQIAKIPSTFKQTNPHIYTTNTLPNFGTENTKHKPPTSNGNYHTTSSSTLPLTTKSNPTYLNLFCFHI